MSLKKTSDSHKDLIRKNSDKLAEHLANLERHTSGQPRQPSWLRYIEKALAQHELSVADDSDNTRLIITARCLGYALHWVRGYGEYYSIPEDIIENLIPDLLEHENLRNQPGHFQIHPTTGFVKVIQTENGLDYVRDGEDPSQKKGTLSECYDPPFFLFVNEEDIGLVFHIPGPTCEAEDAFMQHVMTDQNNSNPIVKLREEVGAVVLHPEYGYTKVLLSNPDSADKFITCLDEYFQEWMTEMSSLGRLAQIYEHADKNRARFIDYSHIGLDPLPFDTKPKKRSRRIAQSASDGPSM